MRNNNSFVVKAFSLLLVVGFLLSAQPVQAQFWKKIFGGHKNEHRQETNKNKDNDSEAKEGKEKPASNKSPFPATVMKERYRVDVLLPLGLKQQVVNGQRVNKKLPGATVAAVNFYEGIRVAANQLTGEGLKVDFAIHDIDAEGTALRKLVQDSAFRQSDLIIGFLSSDLLPEAARIAQQHHINFVSAFSPSDANISDNPYFIMLQPTLSSHIKALVNFAEKRYNTSGQEIFLYGQATGVQKEAQAAFDEAFGDRSIQRLTLDDFQKQPDILQTYLSPDRKNIIYVNVLSNEEAKKILTKIAAFAPTYKIAVVGMPTWKYIAGISQAKGFPGLDIYYSNPYYYDLTTANGKAVAGLYKSKFGGHPSEMVFRGYESAYWLVHLLHDYGTIFNEHISDTRFAPFTRYRISEDGAEDHKIRYWENKTLYIFHYLNGNFNVAN